jgi:hypothetical protein
LEGGEDDVILEVSKGNGPVDALARALNRALVPSFPSLEHVELSDYKVCVCVESARERERERARARERESERERERAQ